MGSYDYLLNQNWNNYTWPMGQLNNWQMPSYNFTSSPINIFPSSNNSEGSESSEGSTLTSIELEAQKMAEKQQQREELEKQNKALAAEKAEAEKQMQNLKVNEEGQLVKKESMREYKKQPWWKKAIRIAGNALEGAWNVAKSFAGYEIDPKTGKSHWNPLKCVKNVAITVACVAATACSSIVPGLNVAVGTLATYALLATGVFAGTKAVVNGYQKLKEADRTGDMEKYDQAWQEMTVGGMIAGTSAFGVGKGLANAAKTGAAAQAAEAAGSSTAAEATAVAAPKGFMNTLKTMTPGNIGRGFQEQAKTMRMVDGAEAGTWDSWKNNMKSMIPKKNTQALEANTKNTLNSLESRFNELEAMRGADAARNAMIDQEQSMILSQMEQINNTIMKVDANGNAVLNGTKEDLLAMRGNKLLGTGKNVTKTELASMQKNLGLLKKGQTVEINGVKIAPNKANIEYLESAVKYAQQTSKGVQSLASAKFKDMKGLAFTNKYKSEIDAYTGKSSLGTDKLGRYFGPVQRWCQVRGGRRVLGKLALDGSMYAYQPFKWMGKVQGAKGGFYSTFAYNNVLSEGHGLAPLEYMAMGDQPVPLGKDDNGNVQYGTASDLAQMKSELAQYDKQINANNDKIRELYTA